MASGISIMARTTGALPLVSSADGFLSLLASGCFFIESLSDDIKHHHNESLYILPCLAAKSSVALRRNCPRGSILARTGRYSRTHCAGWHGMDDRPLFEFTNSDCSPECLGRTASESLCHPRKGAGNGNRR